MPNEVVTDPLAVHRAAHERLIRAQDEANAAFLDLEEARKGVIEHLAGELAHVKGIKVRPSSHTVSPVVSGWRPGMAATPVEDPLQALVEVSESRYYQSLGRDKPQEPLAIYHVNNESLIGVDCPHCGKPIEADPRSVAVKPGTRGR